jgi:CRISPR-associated exonuclease Cas4
MILSATSLSSYLYCPRKLFLTRVLRFREPPKEVLVRGSIRHHTYDEINKIEESLVKSITKQLELKELEDKYKKTYTKILKDAVNHYKDQLKEFNLDQAKVFNQVIPYFERESKIRSLNIFSFMGRENVLGEELWKKLMPKINSEVKITSEYLKLRGIIDQVELWQNRLVPVELKTGKMPDDGVWPGHRIQLGCYALLLEEKNNTRIKYGYVNYLDHEEKRIVTINPFLRQEVNDLVKKVELLMFSKKAPACCKNKNKCSACGLQEQCFDEEFIHNELERKENLDVQNHKTISKPLNNAV